MSTNETVQTWALTKAGNASADSAITSSDSQSPDTIDDNIRSIMAAVKKYVGDHDGTTTMAAGGSANALTVTTNQVLEDAHVTDGMRLLVKATADNTSTAVTFSPDARTARSIKRADGSALAIGSIKSGMYIDLVYNSAATEWRAANIPPVATLTSSGGSTGFIFGLTLSNDSGGTTAVAVAAGSARDSTDTDMITLSSALTGKVLGSAWTVGSAGGLLDTGAISNAWYYIFLIKRPDTGVVDALASLSATAPTMPANYTLKRRIGAVFRTAGAIKTFVQVDDRFMWKVPVQDYNNSSIGSTAILNTMTCPVVSGIDVDFTGYYEDDSPTAPSQACILITSPSQTDSVPTINNANLTLVTLAGITVPYSTMNAFRISTSTGQIRIRCSTVGAADQTLILTTSGYWDTRGRLS